MRKNTRIDETIMEDNVDNVVMSAESQSNGLIETEKTIIKESLTLPGACEKEQELADDITPSDVASPNRDAIAQNKDSLLENESNCQSENGQISLTTNSFAVLHSLEQNLNNVLENQKESSNKLHEIHKEYYSGFKSVILNMQTELEGYRRGLYQQTKRELNG